MIAAYLLVVGLATLLSAVGCVVPALICVGIGVGIMFAYELRAALRKIRRAAVARRLKPAP